MLGEVDVEADSQRNFQVTRRGLSSFVNATPSHFPESCHLSCHHSEGAEEGRDTDTRPWHHEPVKALVSFCHKCLFFSFDLDLPSRQLWFGQCLDSSVWGSN